MTEHISRLTAANGHNELLENDNENPTYLKLVGKSFKNEGFKNGNAGGVYVEQGKKYNISFYAMTDDYNGAD